MNDVHDKLDKKIHKGVILDVSHGRFDSGATTFATVFVDEDDPDTTYLFYTGAEDTHWSRASIGLATSRDGINFRKADELNPIIKDQRTSFCSKEAFIFRLCESLIQKPTGIALEICGL